MNAIIEKCKVLQNKEIATNIFDLQVICTNITNDIKPGQFIHINCGGNTLLKRPISVCDVSNNQLRLIYEAKGEGTKNLSRFNPGDMVKLLGPLGNGFMLEKTYQNAVVIGGGIGVFPMLLLGKTLQYKFSTILGFRSKNLVTLEEDFKKISKEVFITTDDGSYGKQGYVSDVLCTLAEQEKIDIVFACGPKPMLKALQKICEEKKIPLQISMEERMGCGVGACLTCPCKVKEGDEINYKSVCKCGPVFWGSEVIWDD